MFRQDLGRCQQCSSSVLGDARELNLRTINCNYVVNNSPCCMNTHPVRRPDHSPQKIFILRFLKRNPRWRSISSVVGETSPSRLATPRHLAIARWRPKISGKGWRDLAIHLVKFGLSNVLGSQFSVEKSSKSLSAEIQQFCFIEMAFQLMKA